ncbi:DUF5058 family protein [Clostridium sp. WLY-B-L2]|uniref:DUF5058 family protein n=1 Tax=Clostridium aromativorans TaxID=2836848 RepID=A0ABS8N6J1_9CLOT|nr:MULTISPECIES: DUF5058 family protein [Clostridium]KAA8676015.1 DUF5058 family protein [Clostridium sp. HV4-5-A1G]MCC9295434.1 DUF5058 family protein [Clostridium aromativorans]CAB1246997.1 conserved membrane hypothetical protein [Clostridiaceae bacterium BL-3]
MNLKYIMDSPGLWIASCFTVIAVAVQSVIFLKAALKEAKRIKIPKDKYVSGIRSAIITSIGPSLSPAIILISLITVIGAPTTWMRLSDVGAARTELSMVTLASGLLGVSPSSVGFGMKAFSYSVWGMALNDLGWLLVALFLTHRMSKGVKILYSKYDPKWIKLLMFGASIGLFAFLLSSQLVTNTGFKVDFLVAAFISGITMLIMLKLFKRHQRLKELSLGIAMLVGMLVTHAIY